MDSVTRLVLGRIDRIIARKSCAVPTDIVKPFIQACRDKHISVNEGAYAINLYGRIYGQYFYID